MAGLLISTLRLSPVGTTVSAGLPNITGQITTNPNPFYATNLTVNGALFGTTTTSSTAQGSTSGYLGSGVTFDASYSNNIYSNSCTTVTPESLATLFYIKA